MRARLPPHVIIDCPQHSLLVSCSFSPSPTPDQTCDFFTVLYFPNQIRHPSGFFDQELPIKSRESLILIFEWETDSGFFLAPIFSVCRFVDCELWRHSLHLWWSLKTIVTNSNGKWPTRTGSAMLGVHGLDFCIHRGIDAVFLQAQGLQSAEQRAVLRRLPWKQGSNHDRRQKRKVSLVP